MASDYFSLKASDYNQEILQSEATRKRLRTPTISWEQEH